MSSALIQRAGNERWLFTQEFDIRAALKSTHKAHTFSVDGIKVCFGVEY